MLPIISNTAAGATAGTGWTQLIAPQSGKIVRGLRVTNEGAAPGWISLDGGASQIRLPQPGTTDSINFYKLWGPADLSGGVSIKRDGATDLSGVWVELF